MMIKSFARAAILGATQQTQSEKVMIHIAIIETMVWARDSKEAKTLLFSIRVLLDCHNYNSAIRYTFSAPRFSNGAPHLSTNQTDGQPHNSHHSVTG